MANRESLLARIDTARLRRGEENTVALVVLNTGGDQAVSGRVRFSATYQVRAESVSATQGVIVRDEAGAVVTSRLVSDELRSDAPDLPPGKVLRSLVLRSLVLRSLVLEFAVVDVPAHGGRAYAAVYGFAPESRAEDAEFWESLALLDLPVWETDCHPGDLPPTFTLP